MMTEADLQAVADLVLEREGSGRRVRVRITTTRRGHAYIDKGELTVPIWALAQGDDFAIYYTIHEVAHFYHYGHGDAYKRVEDRLLSHWELSIGRKKHYPRTMYSKGEIVYLRDTKDEWHTWKTFEDENKANAAFIKARKSHPSLEWKRIPFDKYWLVQWKERTTPGRHVSPKSNPLRIICRSIKD